MLIVERTAAAPETRLAVAGDVPREADARSEVVGRRVGAVLRHARIATERFTTRRSGEDRRVHVVLIVSHREHFDATVLLVPGRCRLEPGAKVQRQPVVDAEVVLHEQRSIVRQIVLVLAGALVEAADLAEQEIGKRIAGAGRSAARELKMSRAPELVADLD